MNPGSRAERCKVGVGLAGIAVMLTVSGCAANEPAQPAPSQNSTTSHRPTPKAELPSRLSCAQAFPPDDEPRPDIPPPRAGALSSYGWKGTGSFAIPTSAEDQVGQYVDYTTIEGTTVYGGKVPVSIKQGAPKQRISITSPPSAGFAVSTAKNWTSGFTIKHLSTTGPDQFVLSSCAARRASYPGLIFVTEPSCVQLLVENLVTNQKDTVRVPMYQGKC